MTGIFDSGVGGLSSARELSLLLPREDIIYLADRENAPYGTKTKEELLRLVGRDIKRLRELGADVILAACCTASTIHPLLTEEEQAICIPIIEPTARRAADFNKITVISTLHTRNSHAFRDAILARNGMARVDEFAMQELVREVECGSRDGRISKECEQLIERFLCEQLPKDSEALILGCTHFSHLLGEFKKRLGNIEIIDPAKLGALEVAELIKRKRGKGRARRTYA